MRGGGIFVGARHKGLFIIQKLRKSTVGELGRMSINLTIINIKAINLSSCIKAGTVGFKYIQNHKSASDVGTIPRVI